MIYLIDGKLRVDFIINKKYLLKLVSKGYTIMLIDQGHGFKILKKQSC